MNGASLLQEPHETAFYEGTGREANGYAPLQMGSV